jgi:tetratricopeptide (TPR) repeat protein
MPAPSPVEVRRETVVLPTYEPHPPDRNPMFLEKRVYQGSSGRVYPLPFVDRINEQPRPCEWDAVYIENAFVRVTILPELGGRIHRIEDKTNGYDAIYHQPVIKPALVGLSGPWCSGGIEFNWPQHHRPSTFMPADVAIEKEDDGSATVWLSEHDPMARMKGMHGVRLYPDRSYVELRARVYNRTPDVQTFLWWANVATRVHEFYQSFFPPDVSLVADHAKRAISTFPICSGRYYGVDYAGRAQDGTPACQVPRQYPPPHSKRSSSGNRVVNSDNRSPADLSWYANIPVPTSYMCIGTDGSFAGGYDHRARAGLVHVANPHISPGKKQWTWGNHEFGYAWDRNLTDRDPATGEFPPYIELMAGVYTDNQPDFSYLQPGETKSWSQFWYPIREIGPACAANRDAALSFRRNGKIARIGVHVTRHQKDATITLWAGDQRIGKWSHTLNPAKSLTFETPINAKAEKQPLQLSVLCADGTELISYSTARSAALKSTQPATEPLRPSAVASSDELYLIGLHLEQYRHATRMPESYWREALRRDPQDSRCNLALGRWHLRRGELTEAESHLRRSIERLTSRNPNPYDGEAYYQLGLCLRHQAFDEITTDRPRVDQEKLKRAYAAFYKSTWNHAWQPAAFHALAEIDCLRNDWSAALPHLERALRGNADNLRARNLLVLVLRQLGRDDAATRLLQETLALDPLDWWARHLKNDTLSSDAQVKLDLALDYARAGFLPQALDVLRDAVDSEHNLSGPRVALSASLGTAPLVHYYRAWIAAQLGDARGSRASLSAAEKTPLDYCFPARLEEIGILRHAIAANPRGARAAFYLGNLLYDRRRHSEAIASWERAAKLESANAIVWRNLGIAYFNIERAASKARAAYEKAFRANPTDARLLYERDQLWKRLGESPARRLAELKRHPNLVQSRDDLSVELCALLNLVGQPEQALARLASRKFQPWEGGEGQALGQHVRTHLALGRRALEAQHMDDAVAHFESALAAPENLGEAKHLLANQSDIHFWLGCGLAGKGDADGARRHWTTAAEFKGDFQEMSVRAYSEMTLYSALALQALGRISEAKKLLRALLSHAGSLANAPAQIDYFATSLPTMLLFDDDLDARQKTTALFIEAQARFGLGQQRAARTLLRKVLRRDPNHALATEMLTMPTTLTAPKRNASPRR